MSKKDNKKFNLTSLILMIFTAVYGFANMPRAFYLMGYSAIPWYIFGAFFFFIPFALMMAEYGSCFKDLNGGMYSWLEKSVGARFAFMGTLMWYASYLIWMSSASTSIWIPLSNSLFGYDTTKYWSFLGLSSLKTLGILGILWFLIVTYIATKGVDKISKITSIGGSAITLLNLLLLGGGITVFIFNGKLQNPINNFSTFFKSPNPAFQNSISTFSFLTFAIFAFGGLEAIGSLVDKTEKPEKTFPKGIFISTIIISLGYSLGIFACGFFINWTDVLSNKDVNIANVTYIIMSNLGVELGKIFNLTNSNSMFLGTFFARFVGLSMFLAQTGAFFTLAYSPLKTLIQGVPKEIWPYGLGELTDDMPIKAMKIQALIVTSIIFFVSFGGKNASDFFLLLSLMTNVAMTIPYMFLSIAFPIFKKKQLKLQLPKGYIIYKTYNGSLISSIIVTCVIGFANLFTILEPLLISEKEIFKSLFMVAGPILFSIIGLILYKKYQLIIKKEKKISTLSF